MYMVLVRTHMYTSQPKNIDRTGTVHAGWCAGPWLSWGAVSTIPACPVSPVDCPAPLHLLLPADPGGTYLSSQGPRLHASSSYSRDRHILFLDVWCIYSFTYRSLPSFWISKFWITLLRSHLIFTSPLGLSQPLHHWHQLDDNSSSRSGLCTTTY